MSEASRSLDVVETLNEPISHSHFSVSRLRLLERCELAFKRRYHDKPPIEDAQLAEKTGVGWMFCNDAPDLGTVCHEALESLYLGVMLDESVVTFDDADVISAYDQAFSNSKIVGESLYSEGLELIRAFARRNRNIKTSSVLAVEKEFRIEIGGFPFLGFIDRVDRFGDEVRIVDYKSNRMMFTDADLESDLQLSLYGIAAKIMWPWAKRVTYSLEMLRHHKRVDVERTDEQLAKAEAYLVVLAKRASEKLEFRPKINQFCSWCSYRSSCSLFERVIADRESIAAMALDSASEKLCVERRRVDQVARAAFSRRDEIDKVLLPLLSQSPVKTETAVYSAKPGKRTSYDASEVCETLSKFAKYPLLVSKVCKVVAKDIHSFVSELDLDKNQRAELKARLTICRHTKDTKAVFHVKQIKG